MIALQFVQFGITIVAEVFKLAFNKFLQEIGVLGQPTAVGLRFHQVSIDITGVENDPLIQIDSNHFATLQAATFADHFWGRIENPILTTDQNLIIGGNDILCRT